MTFTPHPNLLTDEDIAKAASEFFDLAQDQRGRKSFTCDEYGLIGFARATVKQHEERIREEIDSLRRDDEDAQSVPSGSVVSQANAVGVSASPSGSTLQPPQGASAAIPNATRGWFLPLSAVNDLQAESIAKLIAHAKRARWTNATVRKDTQETVYEADWIKHLQEQA